MMQLLKTVGFLLLMAILGGCGRSEEQDHMEKAVVLNDRGVQMLTEGKLDSAAIYLEQSLDLYPGWATATGNLVQVYIQQENYQALVDLMDERIASGEVNFNNEYFKSVALICDGREDEAVPVLESMKTKYEGSPDVVLVYILLGEQEKAAELAEGKFAQEIASNDAYENLRNVRDLAKDNLLFCEVFAVPAPAD